MQQHLGLGLHPPGGSVQDGTMFGLGTSQPSRYLRTTWMLSAEVALDFSDSSSIWFFSDHEANVLAEAVRKRNVFARHSWENNFYLQRIKELSNRTIIEVFRPGDPNEMGAEAETVADLLEQIAVLSSTLATSKSDGQRKLGISERPRNEVAFIVGSAYRYLSSRSRPEPTVEGIRIDERFSRRFSRCGFHQLYNYILGGGNLAVRVQACLNWLCDSRQEPRLHASVVKTAIALESLLILSEAEPLARSLSERSAFILSPHPATREKISKTVKRFYEARSGVVHGGRKKAQQLTPYLVEAVDRLCLLTCLTIARNSDLWHSVEDLHLWCEAERWGKPSTEVKAAFPETYLKAAIELAQKAPR